MAAQDIIVETNNFVMSIPLRSASKVITREIFGCTHFEAESRQRYYSLNEYAKDVTYKHVILVLRNPFDRLVSGIHRDFWVYCSQRNTFGNTKVFEEFVENRDLIKHTHGDPYLQKFDLKLNFQILPYDNIGSYVNSSNDEKPLDGRKRTFKGLVTNFAKEFNLDREMDTYNALMKKEVIQPEVYKDLVLTSTKVNYFGERVTKEFLWDL